MLETLDIKESKTHLKSVIAKKSLLTGGDWKLASGRKSSFYFNMKSTSLDPLASYCIAHLVFDKLKKYQVNFLGGVALGAIPLVASVSTFSFIKKTHLVNAFFVRKTPKSHGYDASIEGISDLSSLSGKQVIIIEDVTTTGSSCLVAVDCARKAGAIVERVITLVDRDEGASSRLKDEGIILEPFFLASDFLCLSQSARENSAQQA